jgi:hypothetical protein
MPSRPPQPRQERGLLLVSGPVEPSPIRQASRRIHVDSGARDAQRRARRLLPARLDAAIFVAAVADWRVAGDGRGRR